MTRTALSPRLSAHLAEPFLDIHPGDAAALALEPGDLVQVQSPQGNAILRARISSDVQQGDVFAPMHWTGETAPSGRIDALVAPVVDPVSGQPESKAAVCAVTKLAAAWYGFAVTAGDLAPDCAYWARARTPSGYRAELAGTTPVADWEAEARRLFGLPEAEVQSVIDSARGIARLAFYDEGRLLAALFVAPEPVAVLRDYLVTLPGAEAPQAITGAPPADQPDPGPVLCSCFSVGVNTILTAIETEGLMSVEAIGAALGAGTNCGSCRPELAELLARCATPEAAE
jgi:assimilatory nitrate reductase catalytic subunit